jgi:hypothetical protein
MIETDIVYQTLELKGVGEKPFNRVIYLSFIIYLKVKEIWGYVVA